MFLNSQVLKKTDISINNESQSQINRLDTVN